MWFISRKEAAQLLLSFPTTHKHSQYLHSMPPPAAVINGGHHHSHGKSYRPFNNEEEEAHIQWTG